MSRGLLGFLKDLSARTGPTRVALCLGLVLLCTVTESFGLLALVPLLQVLDGQSSSAALAWLAHWGVRPQPGPMLLGFMALMLLRAWLGRQRDIRLLQLRLDYIDALRRDLEASLAGASWRYLVALRHADVMHLLYDELARINQGTFQALQLVTTAGLGLASLVAVALVAPAWGLLPLLPLAGLAWLLRGRLSQASQMGTRLSKGQLDLMSSSRDLLGGLKMVKAHGLEATHVAELRQRSAAMHQELLRFARAQSSTRGWFELGGALVICAYLYASVTWARSGLPELVLTVLAFSRLVPMLRDMQLQLQHLLHMLPAFDATLQWMARNRAAAEPPPQPWPHPPAAPALKQQLMLDSVTFRYQDGAAPALDAFSVQLQAGTCTALTGPSGSGKTTLADLALGLLTPDAGRIVVDGVSLSDPAALQAWRRAVAYVSQDTYLFPGSLRSNLCWLSGARADDAIWQALEQADAAGFVSELPGGLDHSLGERGEGLSGGQRQRLALARALLCKPALLVLDEVTSHLDSESEERVNAAIRRLRGVTTVLLIAHRASALAPAERVLTLEAGRLVSDTPG